jgi:flagellar basal-body rod protein FlgB
MAKSFHRDSHRFIPSKKRQSPLNGRQLLPLAARAQKLHPTKTLITLCFY